MTYRQRSTLPFTNEPRGALELLGTLAGETTYRRPAQIRETPPPVEIAGALGMVSHRLGALIAEAVATRNESMVGMIVLRAYRGALRRIAAEPGPGVSLGAPADRWRVRIVLYDAVQDLLFPERQMSLRDVAMRAKMRKSTYMRLYKALKGDLGMQMDEALIQLKLRLRRSGHSETGRREDPKLPVSEPNLTGNSSTP